MGLWMFSFIFLTFSFFFFFFFYSQLLKKSIIKDYKKYIMELRSFEMTALLKCLILAVHSSWKRHLIGEGMCIFWVGATLHELNCPFWHLDWDREKLLEAWMSNAEDCCQRSGVQMPIPPPRGYNTWDTLPSPRTPRTTRSSITSPDEISLTPADDDHSLVRDHIWSVICVFSC